MAASFATATSSSTKPVLSPNAAPAARAEALREVTAAHARAAAAAAEETGAANRSGDRENQGRRGADGGAWGVLQGPPSEQSQLPRVLVEIFSHVRHETIVFGEPLEALPHFEDLALVVLHVFVGMRRVPEGGELRVLVDGDARGAARHVIGDLVAGLDRAAGCEGELVGR